MMYDVVLFNGRVIDPETLFDGVANVGVKDGIIRAITKSPLEGKETVDVSGLVVAPGFIDTHFHCPNEVGEKFGLLDGRTCVMDLEIGTVGTMVDEWYKRREGVSYANFGCGCSHELTRAVVMDGFKPVRGDVFDCFESRKNKGWTAAKANLEQGNEILKIMDQGLMDGAIAISSTVGYMRSGVSAREMFEITKIGANYNRPTACHFRYTPGTEVTEVNGIQELLANAAALGAPAIACHFNNTGYFLVHELIQCMQAKGMNVWGELYPYNAGCTSLNAEFLKKEYWVDTLGNRYEETLLDPATNTFYTEESYNEMMKKNPVRPVVVFKCPDEWVVDWMRLKGVAHGSDSMPVIGTVDTPHDELPNTHPRFSGSCAKALRVGRENNIPLMHSITYLSYISAKHLGMCGLESMQRRGRMQVGMVADITIFDPATVTEKSTFEHGCVPSEGIPHVMVNGQFVVKDSQFLKDVKPGQPIRFPKETNSRSKPLDVAKWKHVYLVSPVEFGGTDSIHEKGFSCCGSL